MSIQAQLEIVKRAAAKMPDKQSSDDVLERVRQGAPYDEFFFSQVSDASWLPILVAQNYFANIPPGEIASDGRIIYKAYLPLLPLQRFAVTNPRAVSDILIGLKAPDNPIVADQILRCMAAVKDGACIASLRPLAVDLAGRPNRSTGIFVNDLLKSWVGSGAFDVALEVGRAHLMATVEADVDSHGSNTWMLREINREVFETLCTERPMDFARILFDALREWLKRQRARRKSQFVEDFAAVFGEKPSDEPDDFSYWLEDFRQVPDGYRDLEITLVSRLFKCAGNVYRINDRQRIAELDAVLRSDPSMLFNRLRWQLYADFPEQSVAEARRDVLTRIAELNRADRGHNYEFAQLLLVHCNLHGESFLSPEEVIKFAQAVFAGPVDANGHVMDDEYLERFQRKQLQPIRSLLKGEQRTAYEALASGKNEIDLEDYKPFRPGGGAFEIVSVAPKEAKELPSMSLPQIWSLLNEWQPKNEWTKFETHVEEDYDELATRFAQLVEEQPERFRPADKWWENLKRPAALYKLLERAVTRIQKKPGEEGKPKASPTADDWENWLGVAEWILSQRPILPARSGDAHGGIGSLATDWTWSRNSVARFLEAAIQAGPQSPERFKSRIKPIISDLVETEDPRLEKEREKKVDEWLTVAINSVRGRGIEVLLGLALSQKKDAGGVEPWTFEIIRSRLENPNESPAIFALFGAKLRLLLYLYGAELKGAQDRLFPNDRAEKRAAAVVAHFTYDSPMTLILQTYASLPRDALKILETMLRQDEQKESLGDFGSQLGAHIAFYYWNEAFESDAEGEAVLDRYFAVAPKATRARLISTIGSIFQKETELTPKLAPRVMRIWERRFATISQALTSTGTTTEEYEEELAEFTDWLKCECFPFSWRVDQTMKAIALLPQAPAAYTLLESIAQMGQKPERLNSLLRILSALLEKPSDELRWSIQPTKLAPILTLGFASADSSTRLQAEGVRDRLLQLKFFDFLEVGK